MKFKLVIVSLLLLQKAFSCSCEYQGSFIEMSKNTPLVALIKVTKYLTFKDIYSEKIPMSMEVELVDVYKGNESRKKVTVWGDNGILCRPYLSEFKEEGYYVIAFYRSRTQRSDSAEKDSDYFISICGAYWLNADIKNSTVTGDVNSKDRKPITINLSQLKSDLLKNE